jgi:hypothetical protein
MWAHLNGASWPFLASMPSTKAFRNSAAVQLPAGLPPVYHKARINMTESKEVRVRVIHVLQVSIGRVDLRAVFFIDGHAPEPVVFRLTGCAKFIPQGV